MSILVINMLPAGLFMVKTIIKFMSNLIDKVDEVLPSYK
jgi:hypothetical protein